MPVSRNTIILSLVLLTVGAGAGWAEDLTADQIKNALIPQMTRSLSPRAPATETADQTFIDTLRKKPSSALTSDDRSKLTEVTASKPAIDLAMEFGYNSDVLRGPALATASKLGEAISAPELHDQTFLIAGYTDAKGSQQTNQKLSERRADSVKRYLVRAYHLTPSNLITVGYGKSNLKNPADPFAQENRRVQAVNILPFKSAGN